MLDGNIPFVAAVSIISFVLLVEVISFVSSGFSVLTGIDVPDMDFDIDADGFSFATDVFCLGKVPILIIFLTFLSIFSMVGLVMQAVLMTVLGSPIHWILGAVAATILSIPILSMSLTLLIKIFKFNDNSGSVIRSFESYIGEMAEITSPKLTSEVIAEGIVNSFDGKRDVYLRLNKDVSYAKGTSVELTSFNNEEGVFYVNE